MAESVTEAEETCLKNETLINMVQNYRCIYDKSCKDYKDTRKKRDAWTEIAQKLKVDVTEAQKRYTNIRTNFSKYIKKVRGKSGTGTDDLPELRDDYKYLR